MALEASDLSDGAILESTQQFQNGNGQVQFKITLPSGRELTSEWLSPDMKKKAMVSWLDVVKDQAILDADQARAEAREEAMKQRKEAALASPPQTLETSLPDAAPASFSQTQKSASGEAGTGKTASASPDDYVAAGLKAAEADYIHWNDICMDAAQRMTAARHNIDKWTNIKRSLEGHEQSSSINRGSDPVSSGTGSRPVRRRRKRAVAKSTDFKSLEGQFDSI